MPLFRQFREQMAIAASVIHTPLSYPARCPWKRETIRLRQRGATLAITVCICAGITIPGHRGELRPQLIMRISYLYP
jgi:hypothetical protein